jgi:hypothetical protein
VLVGGEDVEGASHRDDVGGDDVALPLERLLGGQRGGSRLAL